VKIRVLLFGQYARLLPPGQMGNGAAVEIDEGTTIADALDELRVPADGRSYVRLNGERAELSSVLCDNDEVRVIVPLGGG